LNKKIKAIIVKSYLDNHLADLHRVDTAFHINDIVITDFKYENATFFFKLSFSLEEWFSIVKRSRTFHKGRIPPYDYNLSFPMIEFSSVMNTQFPGARIIRVENLKSDTIPEEISRVFRPLPYENLPIIEINSIKSDLKEYAGLIDGSPISFLDNYSRMFYLSSVTITTSGFGDIVPITNRARMIISIEALLGIIIAGLFLNAINRVTHQ